MRAVSITLSEEEVLRVMIGDGADALEFLKGRIVRSMMRKEEGDREEERSPKVGQEASRALGQPDSRTFAQVYESFYAHKFGPHAARTLSEETRKAYDYAFRKLAPVRERRLDEVDIDTLEALVNRLAACGYSKTSVSRVVTLIHQLYRYAHARGYCRSDHGLCVEMPATREEVHHQDFTDGELRRIWEVYRKGSGADREIARMILIMCYSGFRIGEYETLRVEAGLETPYFQGGMKTAAGRGRVVPIHEGILQLVKEISQNGKYSFLCGKSAGRFRKEMKRFLVRIGVDDLDACRHHTPHSTRHTFSRLCESYGVSEADRKRMMGHSLKNDLTNGTYGHRSVEELKREIEKIKIW